MMHISYYFIFRIIKSLYIFTIIFSHDALFTISTIESQPQHNKATPSFKLLLRKNHNFLQAHNGTIFLDKIKKVEAGNFREDLFYRLNVISIKLPPLRARKEDIPLLVNSIVRRLLPNGKEAVIPPTTMQLLSNYNYPGNVRELENILERAIVLGGEVILPEHLPNSIRTSTSTDAQRIRPETTIIIDENIILPVNLDSILLDIERKYLEVALLKTNGLKKRAADLLGINFRSFRYRLQKFGISDE